MDHNGLARKAEALRRTRKLLRAYRISTFVGLPVAVGAMHMLDFPDIAFTLVLLFFFKLTVVYLILNRIRRGIGGGQ